MVRFNDLRFSGCCTGRFNYIRVYRALRKPLHIRKFLGLALEDIDESLAYDLAFLLGISDSLERREKLCVGVDTYYPDAEMSVECIHHLIALVQAQQAVIDKNARQLIPDRFMQQCSDDRGINAAGEPQKYVLRSNLERVFVRCDPR